MKQGSYQFRVKDVLILALLILLVYILAQKVVLREQLKMPMQDMEVYIVAEGLPKPFENDIVIGDHIYQKGAMFPFGKIVEKEVKPAKRVLADANGQYKTVYLNEQSDVGIKIVAPGFVSLAGSPIIDNTFFYSNQYLPVFTEHAQFTSRVINIRKE